MDVRGEEKSRTVVSTTRDEPPPTQRSHQRFDVQWTMFNAIGREKKRERQRKMGKAEKERNNKNVRDEGRRKQFEGEDVRRG